MKTLIKSLIKKCLLIILVIYCIALINKDINLKYVSFGVIGFVIFKTIDFIKYKIQWSKLFRLIFVKKNPCEFLDLVNKYIRNEKKMAIKSYLLVYKALGLQYKGNFDDSLNTLEEVSVEKLEKNWRTNYYLNYFLSLIFYSELEKAKEVFEEAHNNFKGIKVTKDVKPYIQKAYAIYEYYYGDKQKSKDILLESLDYITHDYHKAICYYYVGLIIRESNNTEENDIYFDKAITYGKNSFIEELASKQLK